MEKYIYQIAMNQNSKLDMEKDEKNENIGEHWIMTGGFFIIIITVAINLLEFQFSNLKQGKHPVTQLHICDTQQVWCGS